MEKTFEYVPATVFVERLEIKDIGNTIIEARDSNYCYYYIAISTEYGITRICEWGPYVLELPYEIKRFDFKFDKMNYSESKIIQAIGRFLNRPGIEIAEEISFEKLQANCQLNLMGFIREGASCE